MLSVAEVFDADFFGDGLELTFGGAGLGSMPGIRGSAVTFAAAAAALSVAEGSSFFGAVPHPLARRARPAANAMDLIARLVYAPDHSVKPRTPAGSPSPTAPSRRQLKRL